MKLRLSPKQQEIVSHESGALLVVAGPGSGKTRVLTERIRRLLADHEGQHFRILALTFTNKAANEMRERLSEFPDINSRAYIGTVHGFCMEVLQNRGRAIGIDGLPNIFESFQDRKQILVQSIQDDPLLLSELRNEGGPKEQGQAIGRWLTAIEDLKNQLKAPEAVEDSLTRRIYEAYNKELKASNAVDFGDLLLLTYQLFTDRPKTADFYRRQYQYICIDEAQDLNEAQYQLLRSLTGGQYFNVMVVGDPKQAIYEWNGASPKYLELFVEHFKAKKIELNENYRSSTSVVSAATSLIPSYTAEGKTPIKGQLILIKGENEEDEAKKVLDFLQNLISKGHPDIEGPITLERCALLARNKYIFGAIEKELKVRNFKFYKQVVGFQESESETFKNFELAMKVGANPRDRLHLQKLLAAWKAQEITLPEINNFGELTVLFNKIAKSQDQKAVVKAISSIGIDEGKLNMTAAIGVLAEYGKGIENENEKAIFLQDQLSWEKHWEMFVRTQPGGQNSLSGFLGHVALGTTQQPTQEGLVLLTVHAAKGLEFDVVVLMGLVEGVFPDYRATGESLKEENRSAFVAVTRSRRILALSYPAVRQMPWGDTRLQTPSRYLKTVKGSISEN